MIIAATATQGDYTGELFTIGGIVLVAVLGLITSAIVKKLREPTRIETLWERVDSLTREIWGDPEEGTPGLRARMEEAERRDASKGRLIRSLARQWPHVHTPKLDPDLLADLDEGLVPDHWRTKPQ
jgi:hypothetical protein